MAYFETDDKAKLYYQIDGTGEEVIVLIHGWSGNNDFFRFQIPVLSKKYKVVSYDLRGHGKSEIASDGYTIERYAQDLNNLLDYLNIDKVSIIGWSLGTHVIFEYIKQYGNRRLNKLILVDMSAKLITEEGYSHGLYGNFSEKDNLKFLNKMNAGWKYFADYFVPTLYASNVEIDPALLEKSLNDSYQNSTTVMTRMWISISTADYRDMLQDIKVPTLITYGKNSTLYNEGNSYYLNSMIKGSKVVGFDNCGHRLMVEDPDRFNEVIMDFIDN